MTRIRNDRCRTTLEILTFEDFTFWRSESEWMWSCKQFTNADIEVLISVVPLFPEFPNNFSTWKQIQILIYSHSINWFDSDDTVPDVPVSCILWKGFTKLSTTNFRPRLLQNNSRQGVLETQSQCEAMFSCFVPCLNVWKLNRKLKSMAKIDGTALNGGNSGVEAHRETFRDHEELAHLLGDLWCTLTLAFSSGLNFKHQFH